MEKYIYDNSNGLWYELHGDYYLPCLAIPEEEVHTIGIWGTKHQQYLREHLLQTVTDFILIIVIHHQMVLKQCQKKIIGDLYILHFRSLPFRVGGDDGDGVLDTATTLIIIVTTVTHRHAVLKLASR